MSCDYSPYFGYSIARLQSLIAQTEAAMESAALGKTVQRVAVGDMAVAFSNANYALAQIEKTLAVLRAALKAARAAPDGLVPEIALTPRRAVFPWGN